MDVINCSPRLLPKEILKEPFGLLTSKVRSPSHFSRSPGVQWGRGRGVGRVVISCGNIGEGHGGSPSLFVEIFHETRIWSNTKNPSISTQGAYFKFRRRQGALIWGGGGGCLIEGAYLFFPKSWPGMIIFFNTSSVQKQHKLLILIKNLILNYCGTVSTCNFFLKFKCVHKLKQCTNLILQGKNYTPLAVSLLNCSQNGGGALILNFGQ